LEKLNGPVLVLGADTFVGAAIMRHLLDNQGDVTATCRDEVDWRLRGIPAEKLWTVDDADPLAFNDLLRKANPKTILDCLALHPEESDAPERAYRSSLSVLDASLAYLKSINSGCYIRFEPSLSDNGSPSADIRAIRSAGLAMIRDCAASSVRSAVLSLSTVYGPEQDPDNPVARYVEAGSHGKYPPVSGSWDLVYIDDVASAAIAVALQLPGERAGIALSITSGIMASAQDLVQITRSRFNIDAEAALSEADTSQNVVAEHSSPAAVVDWQPSVSLADGFSRTADWYQTLDPSDDYIQYQRDMALDKRWSVSAVVLCWHENPTIPYMYKRATDVFTKLGIDYEIIFVNNDNSPDDAEEIVKELSRKDHHVVGLSLSRNWSPPAAMLDGVRLASKNAVVTLDGDLQDPPEMIEQFVELWKQGYEVVYGRRVSRVAPWHIRVLSKAYYRILKRLANIDMPQDAGEFSLMDRRVVDWLNSFPERELFPRGLRAYIGFRSAGVDYVRPERMFGKSSNNMARLVNTAKIGIFQFSSAPLTMMTYAGFWMLVVSILLALREAYGRITGLLFHRPAPPQGYTTLFVLILLFGSLNLFGLGIAAEYIGKIFEEVKHRPRIIRRGVVRKGRVEREDYWKQTDQYKKNLGRDLL